jgi:hypothetical protein
LKLWGRRLSFEVVSCWRGSKVLGS